MAFGTSPLTSQNYFNAGGVRVENDDWVISYKQSTSARGAIEGMVGFNDYGNIESTSISLVYQIHQDIQKVNFLKWYYGVGGRLILSDGNSSIAALGDVGLDLDFKDLPINICADVFPVLRLTDGTDLDFYGSIGIRYIFRR